MIKKLLIANRGEIACRIMRTARKMGIATVAVYSDADATSQALAMADESVYIGASPAKESYLCGDKIIAAAKQCGADAIHPGYGFLSENPDFAEAVVQAGLIFVGPPASAIRAMGLKDAAKKLMQAAGVPVVPGYHGENRDAAFLGSQAAKITYPILIKARAGGGGKGMRRVDNQSDFAEALAAAEREAEASFGDPVCLIEKYISKPRHIEMQIFGDQHGNIVTLFERDCSLQRRHQKVIEEAPAPGMSPEMRHSMSDASIKAAKAIGYYGAGTLEFIADSSEGLRQDRFWFMEMNTRIQVEHPVTESITGIDLVEWQLLVAAGESLPKTQAQLAINGWAMEARIYAEDAAHDFRPAVGRIDALEFPETLARIDSGVRAGDTISPFYDPMIAKLIVTGANRDECRARMGQALKSSFIAGTVTNLGFLTRLVAHPDFAAGVMDTGLIARDMARLLPASEPPPQIMIAAILAQAGFLAIDNEMGHFIGYRHWRPESVPVEFYETARPGEVIKSRVTALPPVPSHKNSRQFLVNWQGAEHKVRVDEHNATKLKIFVDGAGFTLRCDRHGRDVSIHADGDSFHFTRPDVLAHAVSSTSHSNVVTAPIPARISKILVKSGAVVTLDEVLVIIEAMKMEISIKAPRAGVIDRVLCQVGDQITADQILLEFEKQVQKEQPNQSL